MKSLKIQCYTHLAQFVVKHSMIAHLILMNIPVIEKWNVLVVIKIAVFVVN